MPITWAVFQSESQGDASAAVPGWAMTRYQVGEVVQIRGVDARRSEAHPTEGRGPSATSPWPTPGSYLRRWEGFSWPAPPETGIEGGGGRFTLNGTMGHLLYTGREQREELVAHSSKGSGPLAVIIPLRKSEAWWAMAQDERQSYFLPGKRGRGHTAIGFPYADRIFRRLYHARYAAPAPTLPLRASQASQASQALQPSQALGERWDFVTYFEFPAAEEGLFRALLGELRDPLNNPEWAFVEREMEIWTTRAAG